MKQKQQKQPLSSFVIENNITNFEIVKDKVVSKRGKKVVLFGQDNLLPFDIERIIKQSTTLSSVINSKSEYVSYGELSEEIEVNKDYDYYELSKRVAKDYFSYGIAYIEIVKMGGVKFAYHLPTNKVRIKEFDSKIEFVTISKDWRDANNELIDISVYPKFTQIDNKNRSVIIIKDYDISNMAYGTPLWIGASYDAQVESLIGQYNANEFENGVKLSSILVMDFGDVQDETEAEKKKQKLERELKGTSNNRSGKTLIVGANDGFIEPKYTQYPMDKEGSYTKLQTMIEDNIIKANNWFRSLSGLATQGVLGNNQQIKNEWALAERMLRNTQDKIINALKKGLEIKTEITINNQTPVNLIDDITKVTGILEKKDIIGLNASVDLLMILGLDREQAEKLVNDK